MCKAPAQARKAFEKAMQFSDKDLNTQYETPLKFLKIPKPEYTRAARKNQVTGKVALFVEFRSDGTIGNIFPYRELPDGLTESGFEAARKISFKPAVKDGKAVSVIKFVEYGFTTY